MAKTCIAAELVLKEALKCVKLLGKETRGIATWCVILKRSWFPATFVYGDRGDVLRDKMSRGHQVLAVIAISNGKILGECTRYRAMDRREIENRLFLRAVDRSGFVFAVHNANVHVVTTALVVRPGD
jgi:hypothetical protein